MPNITAKMYSVNRACLYCGKNLYGTPAGQWSYDTHKTGVHFHVACRMKALAGMASPKQNEPLPNPFAPSEPIKAPETKPETKLSATELFTRCTELLKENRKIQAIAEYKRATNVSLLEAKQAIERLQTALDAIKTVKLPDVPKPKAMKTEHYAFAKLLAYMRIKRISNGKETREDIYIPGAPGSGKSWAIKKAAEALGLRYAYIALSEATQPSQIFGYMDANGNYVPSLLYDYYKNGGALDIAETDNTNANVFSLLNNALDNGAASFPCGMVERHPDFIAIGNGNTNLRGPNALFPQRQRQDAASIARFTFISDWDYDTELEQSLFANHLNMVLWVQGLRKVIEQRKDELIAGTREMRKIASLLDAGMDSKTAVLDGLFKGYQATKELLLAHPLTF